MRKEIMIIVGKSVRTTDVRGDGNWRFCRKAFLAITGVPEGAVTCYLVFTTEEVSEDSYRITRPINASKYCYRGSSWQFVKVKMARIAGIGTVPLYVRTKELLAEVYAEGFRYAHVEYDA